MLRQRASLTNETALPSSSCSYQSVRNSIVAGYVAGVFGVAVGHPMDSLKVFAQTADAHSHASTTHTSNHSKTPKNPTQTAPLSTLSVPATRKLSLRTLYAGVSGPLVSVGLIQAINFGVYDSLRRLLHPHADYRTHDSLAHVTMAGFASGAVVSLLTAPLVVVKTKQQIMSWNFQTAFLHTLRSGNFFVAFWPHALSGTFGRAIYFCSYEALKRRWSHDAAETLTLRMIAAGLSGILCWSIIFPLDAIRSRINAQAIHGHPESAWNMATNMYKHNPQSFFRGFQVTVLRAGPVAAAVLPVYDCTLDWLQDHWDRHL